jgi:hypothetical protein
VTTRAHWPVAAFDVPTTDPFAELLPVEQVGTPISLDTDIASLSKEVESLMWKECKLFNVGVTCPIKDHPDTHCSACPVSKHDQPDDPLSPLCRLGREQERVHTTLAVKRGR